MSDDDRPPGGLRFWDAVKEFSDSELLVAHQRAYDADRNPRIRSAPFWESGRLFHELRTNDWAVRQALKAVLGDFWALVKTTGDVIAIGCPDSVDATAREIPPGEWDWLPDRPGKDRATFTGNGRIWYRVLFHRRKSRSSQRCAAALVRVEMYACAAGPDGLLEPGHRYDLPKEIAEPLIAGSAAKMTEEQPSVMESDAPDAKYPGPWNEDDWWEGITLSAWAEWRDPEAWAQRGANCGGPVVVLDTPSYEDERESRLCEEAADRLLEHLNGDLRGGRIVLGLPGELPDGRTRPVAKDTLSRIVKEIGFRGYSPPGEVSWQKTSHEWERFEARVYLPDRFAEVAQESKPAGPTKGRAGRKVEWDWDGARRHILVVANSNDGLPDTQADCERLVAGWFYDNYEKEPAESTVRDFVVKECGHIYHDQEGR